MSGPICDYDLIVRATSDGTLAADCTPSIDLGGPTGLRGLALYVYVPPLTIGCAPTLTITVYESSTSAAASTDTVIAKQSGIVEGGGSFVVPFETNLRSVAFFFDVGGASSPGFSYVQAWITEPVGAEWTRLTDFR
jgi:hypothetical protein